MSEIGRGCWKKVGGATPYYEITKPPTPNVGSAWYMYTNTGASLPDPTRPTAYKAVNAGVAALQAQLNRRLPTVLHVSVDGWLGQATSTAITDFQVAKGLVPDGVAGPRTCRALVFDLVVLESGAAKIPVRYVDGILNWESGYDFGGMGSNNLDTGIAQINLGVHKVSFDNAMNPEYSIKWAIRGLQDTCATLKPLCDKSGANIWFCVVASHNSPKAAKQWATAGHPVDDPARSFPIQEYVTDVLRVGRDVL